MTPARAASTRTTAPASWTRTTRSAASGPPTSGTVNPAQSGRLVYLQQYGNKVWTTIASVKQTSTGYYAFGIKPKVRGLVAYRVVFTADADHAQSISANKTLSVS